MTEPKALDYSIFDTPERLARFFHPRPDTAVSGAGPDARDLMIPVEEGVRIGGRFHPAGKSDPTILFFHGNGEIVSDYDDLGPLYSRMGINFFPVDYRGYGRSQGTPTISHKMRDALAILDFARTHLGENGHDGPLFVMGRSIGSASALEIAYAAPDRIDGLIVESGFARIRPLLALLGAETADLDPSATAEMENIRKIGAFTKPTLVIHAERDHIIPFADGQALFDTSPSSRKRLLMIPAADHNTIFAYGLESYMEAVKDLVHGVHP